MQRKAYPSDVTDGEWALVAPYLTLMTEDAPQRTHSLREVFNGLRWIVRAEWIADMPQSGALRPRLEKLEAYLKSARPAHDVRPVQQLLKRLHGADG